MSDAPEIDQMPRARGQGMAALMAVVAMLAGCSKSGPMPMPPPPDVSVACPVERDVVEWDVYTGYLQAPEVANVAARVSGLIVEMPFEDGSIVKQGDLLAKIDDRPYKAELDSKLAEQQRAEAVLSIANLTYERRCALKKEAAGAVSQQDIDNAEWSVEQAKATLAAAKAAVESSRLNLEWCRVLSPIDGRISNKFVTVGNLVIGGGNIGQATLLTTVQSVDRVYCYVDVDEHSVLKYQKLAEDRSLVSARDGKVPCYVELGSEKGFPHKGVIDFMDNHVDQTTGTMRIRGVLKNESGKLIPGLFARLTVPGSGRYHAILLPDSAIGNDQSQRSVLVVDKDNKVAMRPVKLGALFGGLRAITSGIRPDDRVVVNGQMRARPGLMVSPIETPIKVDDADFADPGVGVAGAVRTKEEGPVSAPGGAVTRQTSLLETRQ